MRGLEDLLDQIAGVAINIVTALQPYAQQTFRRLHLFDGFVAIAVLVLGLIGRCLTPAVLVSVLITVAVCFFGRH